MVPETTGSPNMDERVQIPFRVDTKVPLVVKDSSIKSNDVGIFVQAAVKEADLIFKVKKPLLNIVNDDESALSNTCDHCFAVKASSISSQHTYPPDTKAAKGPYIDDDLLTLKRCGSCKVYSYCSKTLKTY
ncbi:hypothetical protein M7I_2011 [Glarea lozoyensis 74030]|uniref:Uncharacterized protein n=1 Tax=Glarea lozoyensis (strain ATCC 74030 / MF5533) TaxID=1104152 RepID=H0EHM7_GLAL7|nr:hypothetical protein M7I_2011 [Glarea lozoyensis 74030]